MCIGEPTVSDDLAAQVDRLQAENDALRAAARLSVAAPADLPSQDGPEFRGQYNPWQKAAESQDTMLYAWLWLRDSTARILSGRLPSPPYFSRPMPMIASITGGVDHSLAAAMHGRACGGPQVFRGAWHATDRCRSVGYLPQSVIVITPGFVEVPTASGATHLVQNGGWVAKRRASAMAHSAALTFGRPRVRGAVKA